MRESEKKAIKKHLETLDDIKVRVPKGKREIIKAHAESKGMSLNAYIVWLIDKDMEKGEA